MIRSAEVFALSTFPGVIIHEISHRFFCDILKVKVYDICYLNLHEDLAGYVIHEKTKSWAKETLIAFAPRIVNSILCILFTLPFRLTKQLMGSFDSFNYTTAFSYKLLYWVGISAGYNAIPSDTDVKNLEKLLEESKERNLLKSTIWVLANYVLLFNHLSKFWIKIIYCAFLVCILPYLLTGIF